MCSGCPGFYFESEATGLSSLQSILPIFKKAHHGILVHNSFTSSNDINAVKKQNKT